MMKGPLIYYEIKHMYGTDLSSTKLSSELRKSILEEIDLGFNVEIDFQGVRCISNGWARNLIGVIVKEKGEKFVKDHILLSNMTEIIRQTILEGTSEILI